MFQEDLLYKLNDEWKLLAFFSFIYVTVVTWHEKHKIVWSRKVIKKKLKKKFYSLDQSSLWIDTLVKVIPNTTMHISVITQLTIFNISSDVDVTFKFFFTFKYTLNESPFIPLQVTEWVVITWKSGLCNKLTSPHASHPILSKSLMWLSKFLKVALKF
jgi:hypothetical protein